MNLLRATSVPLVVGALLLGGTPSAASAASPSADTAAVVNLTYDVSLAGLAEDDGDRGDGYVALKVSRPTAAPMPATSPLRIEGFTLSPGTTVVISVFSTHRVNDSLCITGTSTKTPTVVYLSTATFRPTLVRPHGCAKPGQAPLTAKPSAAIIAGEAVDNLEDDLKTMSIGEQSYATDNDGAFVADTVSRPLKGRSPATDVLVQQGVQLHPGDTVVATVFTQVVANDSYCLKATGVKTKAVVYLSSANDTPTTHRPKGCIG